MKLFAATVDLCTPDAVLIDRVQAYLRAYRTDRGVRWGGELIPQEDRQPVAWPDGDVILRLPSGQALRVTVAVVRAGAASPPTTGRVSPAAAGFHQMARVEGIGPPPAECA